MSGKLAILQVSTSDRTGGAERSAKNLFEMYRKLGHDSWLAVGLKQGFDDGIVEIPNDASRNAWVRTWAGVLRRYESQPVHLRGVGTLIRVLRGCGQPLREVRDQLGLDDYDYPATQSMPTLTERIPDVVHLHNLHGNYFDLRFLPKLSRSIPTILNLRDAWLLSGHCAFSFDCEKWKSGCGNCPDLSIFPAIKRDGTARNWKQKRQIFQNSRVHVTTPSQWLMDKIDESILQPAIIERRVIPNGVDTELFRPGSKALAREELKLPQDAQVLMTAANGIRTNIWKDYKTLRSAIEILAERGEFRRLVVLAVGESGVQETIGGIDILFVPFKNEPEDLARYYRAADIYLHTARVESFGNVLLEARACGAPVVATAVGGIPEQVKGLAWPRTPAGIAVFPTKDATGVLTPPGDPEAFADAISLLLRDSELRAQLGDNGREVVVGRFSLNLQAARFLEWYAELVSLGCRRPEESGGVTTRAKECG